MSTRSGSLRLGALIVAVACLGLVAGCVRAGFEPLPAALDVGAAEQDAQRAYARGDPRLLGVASRGTPYVPGVERACTARLPRGRVRLVRAGSDLVPGPRTGAEAAGELQRQAREAVEDRYMAGYNAEMVRRTGSCPLTAT